MESIDQLAPYPEVKLVLQKLLEGVRSILGGHFVGMYLHGSLAAGGFDRDSDVDFLVATTDELPADLVSALRELHGRIAKLDSWCATQLEGSYIPLQALRHFDPVHALHLHIDRGEGEGLKMMEIDGPALSQAWWGGWVLLRDVLWEKGITLAGPDPRTLIDPVSPDDRRKAMLALLHGWVEPLLGHPSALGNRGYQSYTVLTLCRILYTLQLGTVVSKRVATRWAQDMLEPRWVPLISRAWTGRKAPGQTSEVAEVNETLEFIRFTLERSQGFEAAAEKTERTR